MRATPFMLIGGWLLACTLAAGEPAKTAGEAFVEWPEAATFAKGKRTKFRLPFFHGLLSYPDNLPLYNVLYLPKDYDPACAYALCVRFQPQGNKPSSMGFEELSGGKAVILGVSYPLTERTNGESAKTISSEAYLYAATVHWVLAHFSIDRTRVFAGGFSGGAFSAFDHAMDYPFQHLTTHFVVMGAGARGDYYPDLFKGRHALVGAGSKDSAATLAKSAAQLLKGKGLEVTYFEVPNLGHDDSIWKDAQVKEWWARFATEDHAESWQREAEKLEKQNPPEGGRLWSRLAALGPNHEAGKLAQERLAKLEGKALPAYQEALALLHRRQYEPARKAFMAAGAQASQVRSARLTEMCLQGMQACDGWRFCEQLMAAEEAQHAGRFVEAFLLAQDGMQRYQASLKAWTPIWKTRLEEGKWKQEADALVRSSAARAKAQQSLAQAQLRILNGEGEKVRADLDKLAKEQGEQIEGKVALRLLKRLDD